MFKFRKNYFSALALLLSAMSFSLSAEDCCYSSDSSRMYIGVFGGAAYSTSTRLTQTGVAFFPEAVGGPLAVDARGRSRKNSSGFAGVQVGYEWSQSPLSFGNSNLSLAPAAEIEALFYQHKKKGSLINPTDRLPEHDFIDSFKMDVGVYLINGVLSLNSCYLGNFSPYIGGGIGAASIGIRKAKSIQISPPEVGVNHFNSRSHDSAWTFAAQAKAGLRYNICDRIHIFGEYRFLYLDSSRYTLGSTVSPGHVPTTTWELDVKNTCYNAFAFGIQFDL